MNRMTIFLDWFSIFACGLSFMLFFFSLKVHIAYLNSPQLQLFDKLSGNNREFYWPRYGIICATSLCWLLTRACS